MRIKVSIIGGGIAGLTTAIALQQKGIQANVYEAASEVRPVGAGLALSSNAMRVYKWESWPNWKILSCVASETLL